MIEYNGEDIEVMDYPPNCSLFIEELIDYDCRYKIYKGYGDEDEEFFLAVPDIDDYEERKFSYNE